ncbi:nuclear transport factor 2 family protein [Saccharopolyspora sp. 5N708]|uniref:nuclear transport factor 2 family protein n=1 Tax=Saccharopolyspora sp. 5N708 TaxID=3457424 RepID=UPI003FD345BB
MATVKDARTWSEGFLRLVDFCDADAIADRVSQDASLTSGSGEAVLCREAIRAMITRFRTTITSLHHDIVRAWSVPDGVIAELRVTYVRLDGTTLTLPCTNIFDIDGEGLVSNYQIFTDMNPV